MATDISKGNLTDQEIKAGYSLYNDGKFVQLFNRNITSVAIAQWAASLPNVHDLVRAKMRDYDDRRRRLLSGLLLEVNEEKHAAEDYRAKHSMAASIGMRELAKTFEDLANDEQRHADRLEYLRRKL